MKSSLSHTGQTSGALTAGKPARAITAVELQQSLRLILCLIFVLSFDCAAQSNSKKDRLPRVGTVKDYPATGLTVGCANLYFVFPKQVKALGERYVFLARSGGQNAWMNLDGRDVRLKQMRSPRRHNQTAQPFKYKFKEVFVSVVIKNIEPKNNSASADNDFILEAIIILRKGRAVRKIRALGYSDC